VVKSAFLIHININKYMNIIYPEKDWSDIEIIEGRTSAPYVRITVNSKKGSILTLSPGFMHNIKEKYITLGVSKSNNAIVMFFHDDEEDKGAKKINRNGNYFMISIQSLINKLGLPKEECLGKFLPEHEPVSKDVEAWIIYLDKKI